MKAPWKGVGTIPRVVLYLEDVLGQLSHYCTELDLTENGQERPPKHCKCVACVLAGGLDAMLTAEWEERCKKAKGQNISVPNAGDAVAGGPRE